MRENMSSRKRRKALSIILAVAMVATMLLSGTLAFYYNATATNEFDGQMLTKEVVAHDDFNEESGNKDIYMENLGESTVYVRVKLTEDFRLNQEKDVAPTTYNPETPVCRLKRRKPQKRKRPSLLTLALISLPTRQQKAPSWLAY